MHFRNKINFHLGDTLMKWSMGKKSTANSGKAQIKAPHDEVSNNNGKDENVCLKIAFRGAPTGEMGGAWLETG